jgi:hypothetical protein
MIVWALASHLPAQFRKFEHISATDKRIVCKRKVCNTVYSETKVYLITRLTSSRAQSIIFNPTYPYVPSKLSTAIP